MNDIESLRARYREANAALHRLWTKAVGTPGYVKADWALLDYALSEAFRKVADTMGHWGPLLP